MFGQGVYFAEDPVKSDQYADPRDHRTSNGEELKMFMVRVLLGEPFLCGMSSLPHDGTKFQNPPCMKCFKNYTKDLCSCPDKVNFDSIIGHKAPKPDGWLFREFVTYDLDTCYPEYIITYVREG